jgi:predicted nucleic acid-binding Zn ribbon protein
MSEISLGDAIKAFLEKSRLKNRVQAVQITEVWEQIMGVTCARYTKKIQIANQTLFITTEEAALKASLHYQKQDIINRVNELMGADTIKYVAFN